MNGSKAEQGWEAAAVVFKYSSDRVFHECTHTFSSWGPWR